MTIIGFTIPAEMLCLECAEARWGAAVFEDDFRAPGHEDETGIVTSIDAHDTCSECGCDLHEVAGYVSFMDRENDS